MKIKVFVGLAIVYEHKTLSVAKLMKRRKKS